jgi:hypothetical protein
MSAALASLKKKLNKNLNKKLKKKPKPLRLHPLLLTQKRKKRIEANRPAAPAPRTARPHRIRPRMPRLEAAQSDNVGCGAGHRPLWLAFFLFSAPGSLPKPLA